MHRIHVMHNPIQHTHRGVVITYNENSNRWQFTLRGRDKSAESLSLARAAIDKPEPKSAKPFAKIEAWEYRNDAPERVTVTGIAEKGWRGMPEVWIKDAGGNRRKEDPESRIYPATDNNNEVFAKITEKYAAIRALDDECSKLRSKLATLKIEEEKE